MIIFGFVLWWSLSTDILHMNMQYVGKISRIWSFPVSIFTPLVVHVQFQEALATCVYINSLNVLQVWAFY